METASGVQVNENNNVLKAAIEALEAADALKALATILNTGMKVRVGQATITYAGGIGSTPATAHGLGKVPTFAAAIPIQKISGVLQGNAFYSAYVIGVFDMDATNVIYQTAQDAGGLAVADGAVTKVGWVAIG